MENYNKQIKKSSIQKNKNSLHDNQITLIKKLVDSNNLLGNINIRFPNKDPITLFNLTLSKLAILSSFNIPIKYLLKKVKRKKSSKHKSKLSQEVINLLQMKNYFSVLFNNESNSDQKSKNPIMLQNTSLVSIFEFADISLSKIFDRINFCDYSKETQTTTILIPKILTSLNHFTIKLDNKHNSISNKSLMNIFSFISYNNFDTYVNKVYTHTNNSKYDLFMLTKQSISLSDNNKEDIFIFNDGIKAKNLIQTVNDDLLFSIKTLEKKILKMEENDIKNAKLALSNLLEDVMNRIISKKEIKRIFLDWRNKVNVLKSEEQKIKYKNLNIKKILVDEEEEEEEEEEENEENEEEEETEFQITDKTKSIMNAQSIDNDKLSTENQKTSLIKEIKHPLSIVNNKNEDKNINEKRLENLIFDNTDDIIITNKDIDIKENNVIKNYPNIEDKKEFITKKIDGRFFKVKANGKTNDNCSDSSAHIEELKKSKLLDLDYFKKDIISNTSDTALTLSDNKKTKEFKRKENKKLSMNSIGKILCISCLFIFGIALIIIGTKENNERKKAAFWILGTILIIIGLYSSYYVYHINKINENKNKNEMLVELLIHDK